MKPRPTADGADPNPPITYGRAWERSSIGEHVYSPPQTLPPIIKGTRIVLSIQRARPSSKNPAGSVKSVDWLWPESVTSVRPGEPGVPPGANTLIKWLAGQQGVSGGASETPSIIVSYAYGYDLAATGENVRKPIWDEVTVPATEEDAETKKRIKVGESDPVPVDSITVAGVWRNGANRVIAFGQGWWLDTKPVGTKQARHGFRIWTLDGGPELFAGPTEFTTRIKEVADDLRRDERLL